jgi:internalin A
MPNDIWDRINSASDKAESLDLSNLGMDTVPQEVYKLTKLRKLDLSGNKLESLQSDIRNLAGLQTLYLNGNSFVRVPVELYELSDLKTLHLHDNFIQSISRDIGKLSSLTTLSLYNNKLKEIPAELGNLRNLLILTLYKNEITLLPDDIKNLRLLSYLNVAHNQLKSIPSQIGELTTLKRLYFAKNRLTELPSNIGNLRLLEGLYLDENQLLVLPESLLQLERLTELTLHGNVDLTIPDAILGPTYDEARKQRRTPSRPYDILHYYFDRNKAKLAGNWRPLNAVKLMLVGDANVGKTSLRRFFLDQPYSPNEPETLGIARDTFEIRCSGKNFSVSVWDFAGQEITHALHKFFLTEGCVYLVVVEPRSDNQQNDLIRWLKEIERYGGNSPVIAVLNKQDTRLNGYDVDQCFLKERFSFIHEFVSTTCGPPETRQGCDFLLDQVQDVVSRMREANEPVPANWLDIMAELRFDAGPDGNSVNYMSFPEFRELCKQHGELNPAEQESLARILHKLGTIVHFIDEPKLRDTTILNPHWVTDGTYRLLRYKDAPFSNGVLTIDEAMTAVPGVDRGGVQYLLDLMERFEMCFVVDEETTPRQAERWLIPGALPPNQPKELLVADWEQKERIRIRYTYDPLPQSVIPRLIVLTHSLNQGELCWRNGVVLKKGLARALVRKAGTENTIEVTVLSTADSDGRSQVQEDAARDCQNLVKIIRGSLDRIHRDLPCPGPQETQELSGLPYEFREIRQLKANERLRIPIAVETASGDEQRDATAELNRLTHPGPRNSRKKPLRVFLSYAHQDRQKQTAFRQNLLALENDGFITFWDDQNIPPGAEWRVEIERELQAMDVFIGLLTTHFRTSEFINREEFKRATERPELKGKLWLLWVDKNTRTEGTNYERFQFIKPGNKAVTAYRNLRDGFDIAEKEIHQRILSLWNAQPESW